MEFNVIHSCFCGGLTGASQHGVAEIYANNSPGLSDSACCNQGIETRAAPQVENCSPDRDICKDGYIRDT
jgi:hypothetical protein